MRPERLLWSRRKLTTQFLNAQPIGLHEVFNRTNHPPTWWWLSFVDRTHSDGVSVALQLGVAIVYTGGDVTDAVEEAWQRDCNPGGEVAASPVLSASTPGRPGCRSTD